MQDLLSTIGAAELVEAELDAEPRTVSRDGAGADASMQFQAQDAAEVGPHCIAHCANIAVPNAQVAFHDPACTCNTVAAYNTLLPYSPVSICKETPCLCEYHMSHCSTSVAQPTQTANQ